MKSIGRKLSFACLNDRPKAKAAAVQKPAAKRAQSSPKHHSFAHLQPASQNDVQRPPSANAARLHQEQRARSMKTWRL